MSCNQVKINSTTSRQLVHRGCSAAADIQTVQAFPSDGSLAKSIGLPLKLLTSQFANNFERANSYVVRSVKLNRDKSSFAQTGSAPNFQGDCLTLCTCKHRMRATRPAQDWVGTWIAGVTSRTIHEGKHWLFYLAKVQAAYTSHVDLWAALQSGTRDAKAGHVNYLGDVFKPRKANLKDSEQYDPIKYTAPTQHTHRVKIADGWREDWHNDINYRHADKYGHPPLLLADPRLTFLWEEPTIYFAPDHCRDFHKWSSLREFFIHLQEARR